MITPFYAALLGFMLIALSVHVIKGRRHYGVALGDSRGDAICFDLQRRMRAQANFSEYTPFFLILLAGNEFLNMPALGIHLFGCAFIAGRIAHAYSLLKAEQYKNDKLLANPIWRIRGMICTFSCLGILSGSIFVLMLLN